MVRQQLQVLRALFSVLKGVITEIEWAAMDIINIEDKVNYWFAEDPRFMTRHSEQTWLAWEKEGILARLRER